MNGTVSGDDWADEFFQARESLFSLFLEENLSCCCCPLPVLETGRLLELGASRVECSDGPLQKTIWKLLQGCWLDTACVWRNPLHTCMNSWEYEESLGGKGADLVLEITPSFTAVLTAAWADDPAYSPADPEL